MAFSEYMNYASKKNSISLSSLYFVFSLKYCFLKFQELIQEAEKYTKDRHAALEVGQNFGHLYYPLETCRKEISCYKLMYNKIGKHCQVQHLFMFKILNRLRIFQKFFFVYHFVKECQWKSYTAVNTDM